MTDRNIIKQFVNDLIAELNRCDDPDLIEDCISRVASNHPFEDIEGVHSAGASSSGASSEDKPMTNREWLNTLDDFKLAVFIILHLRKIGTSYKNILVLERWLAEEYEEK